MVLSTTKTDAIAYLDKKRRKGLSRSDTDKAVTDRDKPNYYEDRLIHSVANDCFPLPECVDPQRRAETVTSLRLFAEHYFPSKFNIAWGASHLDLIESMEESVLRGGGTNAFALPRGSGKTSLAETCAIWSLFHGHKRYVLCLGATAEMGKRLISSLKMEIQGNELLLADFPEVMYPFYFADYSPLRFKFQHCQGKNTFIHWTGDSFSLPSIEGSNVSGSYVSCAAINTSFRGLKRTTPDGVNLRPDFVIIDDPQTDKSAKSKAQTSARQRIIEGAVLGLAGPRQPITVVMPCTVIQRDDLADRFLNRQIKPEWRGVRSKMLSSFPLNMELWTQYQDIRNEAFRNDGDRMAGTKFYEANREAMDAGASVTWEERFTPPFEISAIQHAMNLYFRDPVAFASEYQNDPLIQSTGETKPSIELVSTDLTQRLSALPFGTVPRSTLCLTTGVDIQKDVIFYLTCAWSEDFGGSIVDYGCVPDQPREYFDTHDIPLKLSDKFPGLLQSPLTHRALEALRDGPASREFTRDESNESVHVDAVFIDANWNLTADAVFQFCKTSGDKFWPCHGRGIGAAMLPMSDWHKKTGEIPNAANWRIRPATLGSNRGRHIMYDTNFWKSRVGERLACPVGTPNALLLYGKSPLKHALLADHLSSELPIRTHGRGRDVDEWRTRAHTAENHWWDCLILSAVAASKCGLPLLEITQNRPTESPGDVIADFAKATAIPKPTRRVAAAPPPRKS